MWLRGSPGGEGSASGACTELGWTVWVRAGVWLPPGEVGWLTPEHSAQGSTCVTARRPARGAHTPVGLLPRALHPVHAPRAGSASPVQPKEPCAQGGVRREGDNTQLAADASTTTPRGALEGVGPGWGSHVQRTKPAPSPWVHTCTSGLPHPTLASPPPWESGCPAGWFLPLHWPFPLPECCSLSSP